MKPTPRDEELLIEATLTAHRERDPEGNVRAHPAFHDLDASGRLRAYEAAIAARRVEAGLDPEGLSPTVRAVMARISGT